MWPIVEFSKSDYEQYNWQYMPIWIKDNYEHMASFSNMVKAFLVFLLSFHVRLLFSFHIFPFPTVVS